MLAPDTIPAHIAIPLAAALTVVWITLELIDRRRTR